MSAFVCNDYHVNAVITWAAERDVHFTHEFVGRQRVRFKEQLCAELLRYTNDASVNARYREDNHHPITWAPVLPLISDVQALKAAHCLAYQCCEPEGWDECLGRALIEAIRAEACKRLTGSPTEERGPRGTPKIAGYSDAKWELRDPREQEELEGVWPGTNVWAGRNQ